MRQHIIARITAKALLPLILLFGLYVQFHGDFGPGGGFQAGVIFAAGFVLHALIFGLDETRKAAPPAVIRALVPIGVLLYGGTGIVCLLKGGKFLEYSVLAHDPVHGQHYGVLLVELGVLITVCATMIMMFYAFTGRIRIQKELRQRAQEGDHVV